MEKVCRVVFVFLVVQQVLGFDSTISTSRRKSFAFRWVIPLPKLAHNDTLPHWRCLPVHRYARYSLSEGGATDIGRIFIGALMSKENEYDQCRSSDSLFFYSFDDLRIRHGNKKNSKCVVVGNKQYPRDLHYYTVYADRCDYSSVSRTQFIYNETMKQFYWLKTGDRGIERRCLSFPGGQFSANYACKMDEIPNVVLE